MIDYELALIILDTLFYGVIIIMMALSWFYVAGFFLSMKRIKKAPHSDKYTKFAILIPARNEGDVVKNIMHALSVQTYPKEFFDVWFIVESEDDPTYQRAIDYGYHAFVRDELTDQRKTKGFALQECIRHFKNNNLVYDAYMIFDADNVMDIDYLEMMNDLRQTGVEVGVGYRNFTNINDNWLTSGSAILFTYMNSFTSKNRTLLFKKALIAGTGYYVNAEIIDEAGGWIFTGMTEDTEFTTYCEYHNINMCYYPLVNFYDEQSPSLKTNHLQHIRWVWGFLINRKRFIKGGKMHHATGKVRHNSAIFEYRASIIPFAVACAVDLAILIIASVLYALSLRQAPETSQAFLINIIVYAVFIYSIFVIAAIATIVHNFNRLKLKWWMILLSVVTYPFYFLDILAAFFHGLFVPRTRHTWAVIKHSGKIKDKRAKKVSKNAE